jgi:hypothetical protein
LVTASSSAAYLTKDSADPAGDKQYTPQPESSLAKHSRLFCNSQTEREL